jgi:hypothetical protein
MNCSVFYLIRVSCIVVFHTSDPRQPENRVGLRSSMQTKEGVGYKYHRPAVLIMIPAPACESVNACGGPTRGQHTNCTYDNNSF